MYKEGFKEDIILLMYFYHINILFAKQINSSDYYVPVIYRTTRRAKTDIPKPVMIFEKSFHASL